VSKMTAVNNVAEVSLSNISTLVCKNFIVCTNVEIVVTLSVDRSGILALLSS
jgi:hypothetical protein